MLPPLRWGHPELVGPGTGAWGRLFLGQTGTVLFLAPPRRLPRDLAARLGYKSWVSDVARVSPKPLRGRGLRSIASPCRVCPNTLGLLGVPGRSQGWDGL